ncbi:hypothetical protein FGO68_gene10240 [Halteria grandinella]|uniref:Uncharacterized protein n=1 Tax=Halteria grandinella TaxID=5974 RepID=A0A8J8NK47_HALGN|nr:hypothetical protein FGO68_gene10240 [Halteria grandinella]
MFRWVRGLLNPGYLKKLFNQRLIEANQLELTDAYQQLDHANLSDKYLSCQNNIQTYQYLQSKQNINERK